MLAADWEMVGSDRGGPGSWYHYFRILSQKGVTIKRPQLKRTYLSIATIALALAVLVAFGTLYDFNRQTPHSSDGCGVARFQLNRASEFSNVYQYRDSYDTALVGLRANQSCKDDTTKLVNEGYLLSTKAMAEHFLSRGNSKADLDDAIKLLARCKRMAPKVGRAVSALCEKQEQSDIQTSEQFEKRDLGT